MKSNGFSLVELLLTLALLAAVMTYGYRAFSHSRVSVEAETDRQFILTIPVLLEQFFIRNLAYPRHISDFMNSKNGDFTTPKAYYILNYRPGVNNYRLTATLNPGKSGSDKVNCALIILDENGKLTGLDRAGNSISGSCWK